MNETIESRDNGSQDKKEQILSNLSQSPNLEKMRSALTLLENKKNEVAEAIKINSYPSGSGKWVEINKALENISFQIEGQSVEETVKFLQEALGAQIDGKVGPETINKFSQYLELGFTINFSYQEALSAASDEIGSAAINSEAVNGTTQAFETTSLGNSDLPLNVTDLASLEENIRRSGMSNSNEEFLQEALDYLIDFSKPGSQNNSPQSQQFALNYWTKIKESLEEYISSKVLVVGDSIMSGITRNSSFDGNNRFNFPARSNLSVRSSRIGHPEAAKNIDNQFENAISQANTGDTVVMNFGLANSPFLLSTTGNPDEKAQQFFREHILPKINQANSKGVKLVIVTQYPWSFDDKYQKVLEVNSELSKILNNQASNNSNLRVVDIHRQNLARNSSDGVHIGSRANFSILKRILFSLG